MNNEFINKNKPIWTIHFTFFPLKAAPRFIQVEAGNSGHGLVWKSLFQWEDGITLQSKLYYKLFCMLQTAIMQVV